LFIIFAYFLGNKGTEYWATFEVWLGCLTAADADVVAAVSVNDIVVRWQLCSLSLSLFRSPVPLIATFVVIAFVITVHIHDVA